MKLKSIILIFFYFLSVFEISINAQTNTKNDLKNDLLLGKVRIVKTFYYESKDSLGKPVKDKLYSTNFEEYNESGFKIENNLYEIENKTNHRVVNKYDTKNRLIEHFGESGGRITFEYDSLKRCIQENEYNADKKLIFKTINKYSRDSIMQERVIFNEAGTTWGKSLYDEKGNVTDLKRFDLEGNVTLHVVYKFDERGNEIEEISGQNDLENKTTYTYNDLNQIIEFLHINANQEVLSTTSFKYDDYGNVTMKKSVSDNMFRNYIIHYMYKYDSYGNWIQKKRKNNVKFLDRAIVEREITYF